MQKNKLFDTEYLASQVKKRNYIDIIGDFFALMLKGIFLFVFYKGPVKIWKTVFCLEPRKKIFHYLWSFLRAVLLCLFWILVLLGGLLYWWFVRNRESFFSFWKTLWERFCGYSVRVLDFVVNNFGWIWLFLAVCGSIYGVLYATRTRNSMGQKNDLHDCKM